MAELTQKIHEGPLSHSASADQMHTTRQVQQGNGTEKKEKQKCNFCPVSLPTWQNITGRNVTFLSRRNLTVISAPLHVPFCKSLCSKPLLFSAVYHGHQESYENISTTYLTLHFISFSSAGPPVLNYSSPPPIIFFFHFQCIC